MSKFYSPLEVNDYHISMHLSQKIEKIISYILAVVVAVLILGSLFGISVPNGVLGGSVLLCTIIFYFAHSISVSHKLSGLLNQTDKEKWFLLSKSNLLSMGLVLFFAGLILVFLFFKNQKKSGDFINGIQTQSQSILKDNEPLLNKISEKLISKDLNEIPKILDFIRKQRDGLPELYLIYKSEFEGAHSYHLISSWDLFPSYDKTGVRAPSEFPYYSCKDSLDCAWLNRFFNGQAMDTQVVKSAGLDEYSIYYFYEIKGQKFILIFNRGYRFNKND